MIFISEAESADLVSEKLAYDAARAALIAAVDEDTHAFPVVLGHGSAVTNRFTVKSASTTAAAGVKIGSYWPPNSERGLPRHNSLIPLFDQEPGRIQRPSRRERSTRTALPPTRWPPTCSPAPTRPHLRSSVPVAKHRANAQQRPPGSG
jgi:hypothetical protein